jgi:hypothetical protein
MGKYMVPPLTTLLQQNSAPKASPVVPEPKIKLKKAPDQKITFRFFN